MDPQSLPPTQPEAPQAAETVQPPAPVQAPAANGTEVIAPTPSFSWEASEFVHHEKPALWYGALVLGIIIVCGVLGFLHEWLSVAVVILMAAAIFMYSRKVPRTLQYALDEKGVSINGKISPYTNFKSFNVHEELAWREIDLEPAKRFAPRLTLLADNDSFEQIGDILSHHLPQISRDPDVIEKITRYLKF